MKRSEFLKVLGVSLFLPKLLPAQELKSKASKVNQIPTVLPGGNIVSPKGTSPSVDLSRLLRCIAEVETGNDDTKIGKKGERSKYQINLPVWHWYNSDSFTKYCNGERAYSTGHLYLRYLQNRFSIYKELEVGLLAHAWNTCSYHVPDDYAHRVANLYNDSSFSTL